MKYLLFLLLSFCVLQCTAQNSFFDKYDLVLNGNYFINPYNDVNVKSFSNLDYLHLNSSSTPSYDLGITLKRKLRNSSIMIGANYMRLGLKTDLTLESPSHLISTFSNETDFLYERRLKFDFNKSLSFNVGYEYHLGEKFRVGGKLHAVFLSNTQKNNIDNLSYSGGYSGNTNMSGNIIGEFDLRFRDKVSLVRYNTFLLPELYVSYLVSDCLTLKASVFVKPWSNRNLYESNFEGRNTYEKGTTDNTYFQANHKVSQKFFYPSIGLELNMSKAIQKMIRK